MRVRPQRGDETAAVRSVTARAFATQPGVPDLVEALAADAARVSLVAVDDRDTVIGHVLLSRGWVDAPQRLVEVLVLSPLSVDPDVQGRGIGATLVRTALEAAEEAAAPAVFLEGDPRYYGRHGFVAGTSRGFLRPSVRIPDAGFQVVTLTAHRPWMTGALVYPDAFWRHDSVGLR